MVALKYCGYEATILLLIPLETEINKLEGLRERAKRRKMEISDDARAKPAELPYYAVQGCFLLSGCVMDLESCPSRERRTQHSAQRKTAETQGFSESNWELLTRPRSKLLVSVDANHVAFNKSSHRSALIKPTISPG